MAATISIESSEALEARRRSMLAESDALLDDVELLRLSEAGNRSEAPPALREAIGSLQVRLGRRNPPIPPATLEAAHELVFAVQQRLMAANPNNPRPSRHTGRPSGQPILTVVRENKKWKVLTLPPPSACATEAEWMELVESTVERGWDRWCYAQQQAVRAAREKFKPLVAVAMVRMAWVNYWQLVQEAERLKERVRVRASSVPPGGIFEALRR
jgi:hypothetical protein